MSDECAIRDTEEMDVTDFTAFAELNQFDVVKGGRAGAVGDADGTVFVGLDVVIFSLARKLGNVLGAATAVNDIAAAVAEEDVVQAVAEHDIVIDRADGIFDGRQQIDIAALAHGDTAAKVDEDAVFCAVQVRIINCINVVAAEQNVDAAVTDKHVVSASGKHEIKTRCSFERYIGTGRPIHEIDAGDVRGRIAAVFFDVSTDNVNVADRGSAVLDVRQSGADGVEKFRQIDVIRH